MQITILPVGTKYPDATGRPKAVLSYATVSCSCHYKAEAYDESEDSTLKNQEALGSFWIVTC